jgi:PUA domain protein
MYKKIEKLGNQTQMNKSDIKKMKKNLLSKYGEWEQFLDDLIPKKSVLFNMKLKKNDKSELFIKDSQVLFIKWRKQVVPCLRMLHLYPHTMRTVQVDRGAIKFVLGGANIMSPGLTSAGGDLPDEIEEGEIVAVMAEDKEHAIAIGQMVMSVEEIREKNSGIAIEVLQFLGDDLWTVDLE